MLLIKEFNSLKKNLKKEFLTLKKIKVALLGDTATQLLVQAIRATGYEIGLDLEIWEADFDQIERQVFDAGSLLYQFNPGIIIIFKSAHKLLNKFNKMPPENYHLLADDELVLINSLLSQIRGNLTSQILFYNYSEINDSIFGNYAAKTKSSFLFQIRKLNYELMNYAVDNFDFHVIDISSLQNQFGKKTFFCTSVYVNTEMVLSVDVLPKIAAQTVDLIGAINGKIKKCVILDLDNTLWGGIIGDDGIENIQLATLGLGKAFTEFQYWLKKLKNRGIILAVCSKNTEIIAKEPFEKHADMVLHLEDIAVFVANWDNKADNIRYIQHVLNIGFDSMVFLDDNPFERNLVKENIPDLTVPDLPEDPAEYLEYLYSMNLFETVSFSQEDMERTELYQTEAKRIGIQQQFTNEDDFLKNLEMESVVEPFTKFNIPRAAQLSQRSNQFNLRTIRYTEADLLHASTHKEIFPFTFTLKDRFGDNGLISLVILKKISEDTVFIDTWLMSCRVLKRGMEDFVLNTIVEFAQSNKFKYLKGSYIATSKNEIVKNHYPDLGFVKRGDDWLLDAPAYIYKKCFIKKISDYER